MDWGDESGERKRRDESSVTRARKPYTTVMFSFQCAVWWGGKYNVIKP